MLKRKAESILLCSALVASMLAGCGSNAATQTSEAGENKTTAEAANDGREVVEVTAVLQLNPEISLENNPILQKITSRHSLVLSICSISIHLL